MRKQIVGILLASLLPAVETLGSLPPDSDPKSDEPGSEVASSSGSPSPRLRSVSAAEWKFEQERAIAELEKLGCRFRERPVVKLTLGRRVGDADLVHLKSLPHLRELRFETTQVTNAGLVHLKELPGLQTLEFAGRPTQQKLTGKAPGCAKGPHPVVDELEPEAAETALEQPAQPMEKRDKAAAELESEVVEPRRSQDAALAEIKKLGGRVAVQETRPGRPVEILILYGPRVTDAALVHLKGLTSLKSLSLWATQVTDAGLVHLKGLTNIITLDLTETQITGDGLEHLKGLTNLGWLKLLDTQVTDAELVHLKGLTKLWKLDLSITQATDAGLVHLKGLTELRSLALRNRHLTDAALLHLKGLTNLRWLNLSNTRVTDGGLKHLKGLANLETLLLHNTQVTDAGIKNLQKALPNCNILASELTLGDKDSRPEVQEKAKALGDRDARVRKEAAGALGRMGPEAKEAAPVRDAGLNIEMKLIPAGEFQMGSPEYDDDADNHEKPQHKVRITKPFYLGVTEITQEQYERVMGKNPSYFRGDPQRPVEKVSWEDAVEFCRKLSEKEGRTYRLPTEAEWEYACRAGTNTKWCFGDSEFALGGYAQYKDNAVSTTHAVARKKPNAWGLYDMHGNVWEWCADYCGRDYYAGSPQDDPQGPASGLCRVYRGGSWANGAGNCRSAVRCGHGPMKHGTILGFRVARVCKEAAAALGRRAPEAKEAAPVPDAGLNIEMKLIPAGEFQMGSPESDDDADNHEKPQHKVRITKPFYLGVTEVTQEQYERVMGKNPSYFRGDPQRPVEKVSWEDAVEFCRKLSEKEGRTYRLPTEAEWEYACRAGANTKWCFGDNESALRGYAKYKDNAVSTTHAVARKRPNAWGLYDMHGNVWEWCADYCRRDYYAGSPQDDPQGPASGPCRVYRGGSCLSRSGNCRSAVRCGRGPVKHGITLGFRVARNASDE